VVNTNRPLTDAERHLARWLLEHGTSDAPTFLRQLDDAEVTAWRCECGCASINFQITGRAIAPPGVHILSDYVFDAEEDLSGIFIFESGGLLSGLEVYGLAGNAPKCLPAPEQLRPFEQGHSK
jgi:hypothetical protein